MRDQLTGTSYLLKAAGSHKSQNRVPGRDVDSETQRQLRRKSGREWVGGPAASAWSFRGLSGACRHGWGVLHTVIPLSPQASLFNLIQ